MTSLVNNPSHNSPNPFSTPIQAIITSTSLNISIDEKDHLDTIVSTLATSARPDGALWEFWDAFFMSVATSASHTCHLALLSALRTQLPSQPSNVATGSDADLRLSSYTRGDGKLYWSALPRFDSQWRDVHDILESRRDRDDVRNLGGACNSPARGDDCFLRFCTFSAAFLKETNGKAELHPVQVFYACRNVLESEGPQARESVAHRISAEQLWALDVRVTATWVRDGGRALWETDHAKLRRNWAATLEFETDLWPRKDGLTRERWTLWRERLRILSIDEQSLDEETRAVVIEAAQVIENILHESSNETI